MIKLLAVLFFITTQGALAKTEAPFSISCVKSPAFTNNCSDLNALAFRSYNFVQARIPRVSDRPPIQIELIGLTKNVGRTVLRENGEVIQVSAHLPSQAAFQIVLVHELTHIFRHEYQSQEVLWLDEGLAEVLSIQFSNEYPTVHRERMAQETSVQLSINKLDYQAGGHGYANAYFFMKYLISHFGNESFIRTIATSKLSGWNAVEDALKELRSAGVFGVPEKYLNRQSLFAHYEQAAQLNDPTAAKYALFGLGPNEAGPIISRK